MQIIQQGFGGWDVNKNFVGVSSSIARGATDLSALAESFQWAELMQFKLDTQRGTMRIWERQ